jgi:AmpD protein
MLRRAESVSLHPLLSVDPVTGLLTPARYLPSPNCDRRPAGQVPELLVVHGISLPAGHFGGPWIDALFTNSLSADEHPSFSDLAGIKVSAHALVRRSGEIVQYVPFDRRAWHAGRSSWLGRERCNDYSVGIEVEGTDSTGYESEQYTMLARLVAALCLAYPTLSPRRLVGHSDVAPGRKSDPGIAFDWPLLRALVNFEIEVAAS